MCACASECNYYKHVFLAEGMITIYVLLRISHRNVNTNLALYILSCFLIKLGMKSLTIKLVPNSLYIKQ